jgi:polysaccharide biosynthesis transport protein
MTALTSPSSGYVAISRRALDMEDYIDVARRHIVWIMGPLFAGIVISIVVAFTQQNIYVSQAQMQITPTQISESIVKSTVNQQLTERILTMENEILSRTSLSAIIQDPRLNLYKNERTSKPLEDVIETMRNRDIHIQINVLPGERRASAFTISFQYPDRVLARDTVQALMTKFTDSNLNAQRTQQSIVNTYVHDELSEAKAKLDKLEEELTKFRIENAGKLPEQSSLNLAQLSALQQQSNSTNDALNRLQQQRVQYDQHLQTLQSQLDLLNMFDKEPATAAITTAPLARQQNERLTELNKAITDSEMSLALLRRQYTPKFPGIRDAESRLQELRVQRDKLEKEQDEELAKPKPVVAEAPKKTNYQNAQSISVIQGQIDQTKAEIKAQEMEVENRQKQQQNASKQIEAYQGRLAATSGIESKYADLSREIQSAREQYQVLQGKQQLTDANSQMLQRKAGENLDVLDPPSLPDHPTKPNRWEIAGVGTAISFILGLALAAVQEAKDTSLKNLKDVRAYTNLPVLTSIPLLENTMLVRRKRRMAYLAWSAAIIIGMLAVSASLYYYYHYTYAA